MKAQAWHVDGPHLSADKYLPCHCLNIFIPLVDMTTELGPTELRPASQFLTRDLNKLYLTAFFKKRLLSPEAPLLSKGSILMVRSHRSILWLIISIVFSSIIELCTAA